MRQVWLYGHWRDPRHKEDRERWISLNILLGKAKYSSLPNRNLRVNLWHLLFVPRIAKVTASLFLFELSELVCTRNLFYPISFFLFALLELVCTKKVFYPILLFPTYSPQADSLLKRSGQTEKFLHPLLPKLFLFSTEDDPCSLPKLFPFFLSLIWPNIVFW